jgi:hypothetical protein
MQSEKKKEKIELGEISNTKDTKSMDFMIQKILI